MQERIFEGSLKAVNAPDLLTFINLIKKTGTLTLEPRRPHPEGLLGEAAR